MGRALTSLGQPRPVSLGKRQARKPPLRFPAASAVTTCRRTRNRKRTASARGLPPCAPGPQTRGAAAPTGVGAVQVLEEGRRCQSAVPRSSCAPRAAPAHSCVSAARPPPPPRLPRAPRPSSSSLAFLH